MSTLRLALAQFDFPVGDVAGNAVRIAAMVAEARDVHGADLVLFPELALSGYPPEDLVHRPAFLEACEKALAEVMDLTPRGIRTHLDLNKPIYAKTSAYGHFGRTPDNEGGFSWEKTDLVEPLKRAV